MDYLLKNGTSLTIRPPVPEDAQGMVELFRAADEESPFLIRNPGEFDFTVEQEAALIQSVEENPDLQWYTAFYQGRLVGQSWMWWRGTSGPWICTKALALKP